MRPEALHGLRSKSYLFLIGVLILGALSAFLYTRFPYKLGLDVRGGVQLTYAMDLSRMKPEERRNLPLIREQVQGILVNRATGAFGVAEPVVVPKGEDQFVIELPGYTDEAKAKEVIGTSARVEFYYASTVSTGKRQLLYNPVRRDEDGVPLVAFTRVGSGAAIEPGTPEYAEVIRSWGPPLVAGAQVSRAEAVNAGNGYIPTFQFTDEGAGNMERWSRAHQTDNANLAIVLDGRVLNVAGLQENTVISNASQITGTFATEYVRQLVALVNGGALPVDLNLLSSEKVDPTIGQQALDQIIRAGAIAFVVIALFLIVYYAFPGVVALFALLLYVLFTLTALKVIGATFSLAAIAGFILSVGMAVDANILVFERFKEEMKAGRSLKASIDLGFRRALSAIVDSNACTILTSIVLYAFGTGPVKGFATTLIIGVLISLFTAITVTRSLLMFLVGSGIGTNPKLYAVERNWFGKGFEERANTDPLPVVQKSKKWFLISVATVVVGLPFMFLGGLKGNVEFRGGYSVQLSLAGKNLTPAQISRSLEGAGIRGANVKLGGEGAQRFAEITAPRDGSLSGVAENQAYARIAQAAGFAPGDIRSNASVGPAIQRETIRNAIIAVVASSGLIIVYLALRFGFGLGGFGAGLRFGFSAVGALLHDVLVVLGVTAIVGFAFGWEISALFITSMLTVIGFSVHDTIVIFDRIRENLRKPMAGEDFAHLVNRSVTQSFARSINTSSTVIVTLVILLVVGTTTPDLKLFCATMLAGIVSGTYSSIYNASPILYLWDLARGKAKGDGATLIGLARAEQARQGVITTQARGGAAASPVASAPTEPGQPVGAGGRSYGQVRRRASAVDNSKRELDDL